MIMLSRLNGLPFALNPDLIERAQATPDTVLTLCDGSKLVIGESVEALVAHGFAPEETESIVIGEAAVVATDRRPPQGVSLRTVTDEAEVRAMSALADRVFGDQLMSEQEDYVMVRVPPAPQVPPRDKAANPPTPKAGRNER